MEMPAEHKLGVEILRGSGERENPKYLVEKGGSRCFCLSLFSRLRCGPSLDQTSDEHPGGKTFQPQVIDSVMLLERACIAFLPKTGTCHQSFVSISLS